MSVLGITLGVALLAFLALNVGLQLLIRHRTRALHGAPVPTLPGEVGRSVAQAGQALVYFFSPSCGACRTITPRVRDLAKTHPGVFAVDVTHDLELARALSVLATPSTVELRDGVITGYHVGPIPEAVMARFRVGAT